MKNVFLLLAAIVCFSFSGFSTKVKIGNTTSDWITVRIGFNDGADCTVDEWVNVCIPPGGSTIVSSTIPADVPVMARAYTGCPPDPFAESYTGNPAFGCTPPPDTVPYLLTWYDPMDGEHWGVTVE